VNLVLTVRVPVTLPESQSMCVEIEVVSKSDDTQQCERVIMPSTAGYIVVHYNATETGPCSVFGLQ
jgi:hypothetical protein